MQITKKQYDKIAKYLPLPRGNVSVSNFQLVNAILYVAQNGCSWRALPEVYGNWHTIYMRVNRWSKNGTLRRLFIALQEERLIRIRMEIVPPDFDMATDDDDEQKFVWSPHLTVHLTNARIRQELTSQQEEG